MFPDLERNSDLPSPEWLITLDELLCIAESVTNDHGYGMVLERSDRSEARYLHVCRNGIWFGIRIATHLPVYACSRDYAQIVTSRSPSKQEREFYTRLMYDRVFSGGDVVADPNRLHEYFGLSICTYRGLRDREQARLRHRANLMARYVVAD